MVRADAFAALVDRVAAQLTPIPIVTPEQYRQISCNRCGVCCEDIRSLDPPDLIRSKSSDPTIDADRRAFLIGLEPVEQLDHAWRYRCRHFTRDETGLGVCTIHATRPAICRDYPYGKVVRSWPQCAWFVQVRDAAGNVVPAVPRQADLAEDCITEVEEQRR
jgi:Fe-S-cluster containining protein